MMYKRAFALTFAIVVTITGCDEVSEGEKGCHDYADAFATRAEQCGYDYEVNRDTLETAVGGCGRFETLRDSTSFYAECIPSFATASCASFASTSFMVHASCNMQLQDTE